MKNKKSLRQRRGVYFFKQKLVGLSLVLLAILETIIVFQDESVLWVIPIGLYIYTTDNKLFMFEDYYTDFNSIDSSN